MTFNKCSIAGVCYGDVVDEKTGEIMEVSEVSFFFFFTRRLTLKCQVKYHCFD